MIVFCVENTDLMYNFNTLNQNQGGSYVQNKNDKKDYCNDIDDYSIYDGYVIDRLCR